jgi:predicted YcjX-like family ATPase
MQAVTPNAWDKPIQKAQNQSRKDWTALAAELDKQGTVDEAKLARKIRLFVEYMPEVETRREELKRKIKNKSSEHERG